MRAPLLSGVLLCLAALPAQRPGKSDLVIDHQRRQEEKAAAALREGKLVDNLIRHALGLPITGRGSFALGADEKGRSARQLQGELDRVEAQVEKRAQQLARFRQQNPGLIDPLRVADQTSAEQAPAVAARPRSGELIPHGPQNRRAQRSEQPPARPMVEARPPQQHHSPMIGRRKPDARPSRPVAALKIRATQSRASMGRILYRNGRFAAAVLHFGKLHQDPEAQPESLYFLARSHEQLHRDKFLRAQALEEGGRPGSKLTLPKDVDASLFMVGRELGRKQQQYEALRNAGRSSRFTGATRNEYELSQKLLVAMRELEKQQQNLTAEIKRLRKEQGEHFGEADKLYKLIESRDSRVNRDGNRVLGGWAEVAKAARLSLNWNSTRLTVEGRSWQSR